MQTLDWMEDRIAPKQIQAQGKIRSSNQPRCTGSFCVLILGIELILFFVVISLAIHWLRKNAGSQPPRQPQPPGSKSETRENET
jgi:hypothetical protein